MEVSDQPQAPGALPLNTMLIGLQSHSGRYEEEIHFFLLPGFEPLIFQSVA
jgi:hypothetical protein